MASTGKKGKKTKGKTVPLNDFLSNNSLSWSDQVDEADKLGEFTRKHALPAAPRAARAPDIDEKRIPTNPPYVAYLSNLSYELEEEDIINAFEDLSISTIRLPRDEHSGRLKGFGYVEFADRGSFIAALHKYIATIRGRRIKIDVAENEGERRRGGLRDNRDRDSNYDPERTSGDWRSGPRSEFSINDDRRSGSSGRRDYGGFRERDGYDRGRGGNRESSWRDSDRRFSDRDGRSSYGSRRNYDEPDNNNSEPKIRKKLVLQPRTQPIEETVVKEDPDSKKEEERSEPEKPPPASIFGQARPVDTAAREREIEQRLEKEKEEAKIEKDFVKSRAGSEKDLSSDAKKIGSVAEPKENVWVRKSQRPEAQNVTSRELTSDKASDSDEPLANNEYENENDNENDNDTERERDEEREGEQERERDGERESERERERERETEVPENSEDSSEPAAGKRNDDYESDQDADSRYNSRSRQYNKSDNRYNERSRDSDRPYRRDDRWRDDRDRRDRDRRDDRRDRGYDNDRRGRSRDQDRDGDSKRYSDRDGDSRRYSDRDGESRRYSDRDGDSRRYSDRDGDSKRYSDRDSDSRRYGDRDRDGDYKKSSSEKDEWRKYSDRDGDSKRFQEGRYRDQDDHGSNKGPRGDRRSGPSSGDKGSRQVRGTQERERGPQYKDRPRDQKKSEESLRMPKYKEAAAPNYIGTNVYSFLEEGGVSE